MSEDDPSDDGEETETPGEDARREDEEDPQDAAIPESDEEILEDLEDRIQQAEDEAEEDAEEVAPPSDEEEPDGASDGDLEEEPAPADEIEDAGIEPLDAESTQPASEEEIEEAAIEAIGPEDLQAFHEPESEDPEEQPRTPTQRARDVVEGIGVEPASEEAETRQPRRGPQGPELEDDLDLVLGEPITPVPSVEDPSVEVVDLAAIREDLTYVRILFDEETNRYLYQVIEPPLSEEEGENLAFLHETLVQTLDVRDPDADVSWRAHLEQAVADAIDEHALDLADVSQARVLYYLERDFIGYGPIDVMMQDPMVEDISCDGPGIPLYVYHREHESIRTNVSFPDEDELDAYVRSLAQRSGRHLSIAEPLLDATLPDTSRLQATLSKEVTTRGSSFTIRRFRADPFTIPDLVRMGTMNARMGAWLWMAIEAGSPALVVGGTASGKTTTLSAITQFIPPAKKVVTIEDTREFSLVHENWIAALTRSGGFGADKEREIDMYQLLRTALRQRPEYLVVGEVRGAEAQTLFQAMATGHATYSTMHADTAESAVHRLENPPIDVPRMMLETLDAIVVQGQTRVGGRNVRRVLGITELVSIDEVSGDILTNDVYRWDPREDAFRFQSRSNVLEELRVQRNLSVDEIERDWDRRTRVIRWMVESGVRHIHDVSTVLAAYYANPERLMARIEAESSVEVPSAEIGETGPADRGQGERSP